MSKRDYIIRFILIIKKLRNSRSATFKEINEYIQREFELMEGPKNISLRTFQRDLNDIRTIFNIDIQCNNSNQYYILEDEESGFNNRMMEAFDIINSLSTGHKLSTHVILEKRCSLGTEHIFGLLHAIRNRNTVHFSYKKFYETDSTKREIEPYALKEFKGRWYLLSKDYKDACIKTFALDRIFDLNILKKKFSDPKGFNLKDYFKHCFGVINSNESDPEEVVLSFEPLQGKYIKSSPLHESQKILSDSDKELIIQLTLFITHDFLMELLSYGENVKVIKPTGLIESIKTSYHNALSQY